MNTAGAGPAVAPPPPRRYNQRYERQVYETHMSATHIIRMNAEILELQMPWTVHSQAEALRRFHAFIEAAPPTREAANERHRDVLLEAHPIHWDGMTHRLQIQSNEPVDAHNILVSLRIVTSNGYHDYYDTVGHKHVTVLPFRHDAVDDDDLTSRRGPYPAYNRETNAAARRNLTASIQDASLRVNNMGIPPPEWVDPADPPPPPPA